MAPKANLIDLESLFFSSSNEVQNLTFPKYLILFAFKSFKYSADSLLDAIHE